MKISKEELQQLAKSLYFDMDDKELQNLYNESDFLISSLEALDYFDVDHLSPMYYPVEVSCHTLREDIPIKENDAQKFMKPAKNKKDKYVVVK